MNEQPGNRPITVSHNQSLPPSRFPRRLVTLIAGIIITGVLLGAGLFLSAAANLRALFASHPELIGAQYGDNLVPSGARTTRIVELLRSEMKKEISGLSKDSALLIAYLGHIRRDDGLTAEGLGEMARRFDTSDPAEGALLETVRAAWSR